MTAEVWVAAIAEREPEVKAFAWLDLERAKRLAASAPPGVPLPRVSRLAGPA